MSSGELRRLRFGGFELRIASGELLRDGEPVALQLQPARVLETLARRAGRTVLRREIVEAVWGADAHVEVDQGINYCIRQVRLALGDSAEDPRYVETIPRRGYRFLVPVEEVYGSEPSVASACREPARPAAAPAGRRGWTLWTVGVGALALSVGLGGILVRADRPAPRTGAASLRADVPESAHDRYLEARYLLDWAEPDDSVEAAQTAIALLSEALAEAPGYAEAWAALAEAWLHRFDVPRPEALGHSLDAARRALEIDPALGKAHEILASYAFSHDLDWEVAADHVMQALEADSRSTDALFLQGLLLSAAGRHELAIASSERSVELDPGKLQTASLGWLHFFARDYDRALEEADRVLSLEPLDIPSHRVKVYAHLELGDREGALDELVRFWRLRAEAPDDARAPFASIEDFARQGLEASRRDTSWVNPGLVATYAVYAGFPEQALELLIEACETHSCSWDLPFVWVDPRWDPLRDRPGFERLLRCVGEPARAAGRLARGEASLGLAAGL